MNSNKNIENSPQNAVKTLNSKSEGNHTRNLEKAISRAFVPWLGTVTTEPDNAYINLIEANHFLLSGAKSQLELMQSLVSGIPEREEIQIMAGSISGFAEGLISQINALEAVTDELSREILALAKQRDQALESYSFVKKGGEL